MNTSKLADISEIVSSIAIVITLIFLTVQMKQNTDAIQANSRHTIITTDMDILTEGISYPSIEQSMYKQELTEDEKIQLEWWLIKLCRTREHQWFQYQSGLLDENTWKSYLTGLSRNLSFARTRGWWELTSYDYFDDEFVDEVNLYLRDFPVIHDWVHSFDRINAG